jgi:hypothetical protein
MYLDNSENPFGSKSRDRLPTLFSLHMHVYVQLFSQSEFLDQLIHAVSSLLPLPTAEQNILNEMHKNMIDS